MSLSTSLSSYACTLGGHYSLWAPASTRSGFNCVCKFYLVVQRENYSMTETRRLTIAVFSIKTNIIADVICKKGYVVQVAHNVVLMVDTGEIFLLQPIKSFDL